MKLMERCASQGHEAFDHSISPEPIFDFKSATRACDFVRETFPMLISDRFSALRLALNLATYNYLVSNKPSSLDEVDWFIQRFKNLVGNEMLYARYGVLPTIGFEVESPRKQGNYLTSTYGALFDTLGMPRNKINSGDVSLTLSFPSWEFSPPPSYSSAVQTRILCELIKGGYIPSLVDSSEPIDIINNLDEKLVSLHINFGQPKPDLNREDLNIFIFVSAFTLSFTSAERLIHRMAVPLFKANKNGIPLAAGESGYRLEVKSLEVRDKDTYRLFYEIQLVAAALFAYIDNSYPFLAQEWSIVRRSIERALKGQEFPRLTDRNRIDQHLENSPFKSEVRDILNNCSRAVSLILRS